MTGPRVAVAGAGSIGCFVGGLLAAGGHEVTLLGRSRVLGGIAARGLRLTDFSGLDVDVSADRLTLTEDPAGLVGAGVVLVCVKAGATEAMARLIAAHAPADAPVISLQNGMQNAGLLARLLPGRDVRAGMVPFNVVPKGEGAWHRASSGDIVIGSGPGGLGARLSVPHLAVRESDRIEAVQWGKLLLNLNNALNALSGLTLREMMLDPRWRRVMAAQMAEAVTVLRANAIAVASPMPVPVALGPWILRLPTPVFRRVAARMLTIDPEARTSMAYDLDVGRPTEIAVFQGRIVALAAAGGVTAPLSARVAGLVREAEAAATGAPGVDPAELTG